MAWYCKNCETVNEDYDNICVVCNSLAPSISDISFEYDRDDGLGVLSWNAENTERIELRYSKKQYDVSSKNSFQLEPDSEEHIVLVASNAAADREFFYQLSDSVIREAAAIKTRKKELDAWRIACGKKSYEGYRYYLFEHPLGIHADEARKRVAVCKKAEEEAQRRAAIQAEDKAWLEALELNTSSAFTTFLEKYPYSKYKESARKKVRYCEEREDWTHAKSWNTITALNAFIHKYPESEHVSDAKTIIASIQAKNEEDRMWKAAVENNTKESYKEYLAKYPSGRYTSSARAKIEELKGAGLSGGVIAFLVIIAVVVFSVIVASIIDNANNTTPAPAPAQKGYRQQSVPKTRQPQQQPQAQTFNISLSDLKELENQTEKLIKAMELAKSVGDTKDDLTYKRVRRNLDDLKKYGSTKYSPLKRRYDAL